MHRTLRFVAMALLSTSLYGCLIQEELDSPASEPMSDDTSVDDATAALNDDGLLAPPAPTLTVDAAPGVLNFKWVDRENTPDSVTAIKLYSYNSRTQLETELDGFIEPTARAHSLTIQPHRVAWDNQSYRVEICTQLNCLSSQRIAIGDLLADSLTVVTPADANANPAFGDDIALNAGGYVAVVTSPSRPSAEVLFHLDDKWVHASTLSPQRFSDPRESSMRVSTSASGDTIAIATLSKSQGPIISMFDRLGEDWMELASFTPFNASTITQEWDTASLQVQLADNGNRLVFSAQPSNRSVNAFDDKHNQLLIFDRTDRSWALTAKLAIPSQYIRLSAMSASSTIDTVHALSSQNNALYLHEFAIIGNQWRESSTQLLNSVNPSFDTKIVSSANAKQVSVAAWEHDNNGRRSAVAWKFQKQTAGWVARDSIRTPPTAEIFAQLRLATDAQLQTMVVGWQAPNNANLAFYDRNDERWTHQFSVPNGLNLDSAQPLAQSVAVSSDNSTVLIGTTYTRNGGLVISLH